VVREVVHLALVDVKRWQGVVARVEALAALKWQQQTCFDGIVCSQNSDYLFERSEVKSTRTKARILLRELWFNFRNCQTK